jgi:ectoine hydroxylase-related dioxygenase (phytanoyl-CoA dioxygenase family)
MREGTCVDGVTVRVVEMTGEAGDVYFMHPSLLHAPSPNACNQPRLALTQWIDGA